MAGAERATVRYLEKGSGYHGQGRWELVTQGYEHLSKLVGFTSGESGNTQNLCQGSRCSDFSPELSGQC